MSSKQQTLSLAQAAVLLGRSERFVGNLRERGYVETPQHGRYPLVGLVRGLIAYLDDQIAKQAETARQTAATDARTREIELRIQRKLAHMIEATAPGEIMDEFAAAAADEMRAIPARLYQYPDLREAFAAEIEASIARVDGLTADAKRRLESGEI